MKSVPFRNPAFAPICLLFALGVFAATLGEAQNYKADEYDKRLSARGTVFRNFVKQPAGSPELREEFEQYITKYYLPAMTQYSPEALEDLGKLRSELFGRFLWPATPELQTWMTQQAYEWAKSVAPARYHPAVQFNAIYILGLLDETYAGRGQAEPTPLPAANDELNRYARLAARRDNVPRRFLAASLAGLERQTRYFGNLPAKNQRDTQTTLYGVLNSDALPGDYEKEVLGWIHVTAAQALANTKTPGPNGAFFLVVAKRAADSSLDLDSRAELVATLAQMNAEKGSVKAAPAAAAVRELAAKIAAEERKIAKEFEDLQLGSGMRDFSTGRGNKARRFRAGEDGVELVREDLLVRLGNLQKGVQAIAAVAADADAASLNKINDALDVALRSLRDKDEIDLNVADAIKQMASQIAAAAEVKAEGAAPAAVAAAETE